MWRRLDHIVCDSCLLDVRIQPYDVACVSVVDCSLYTVFVAVRFTVHSKFFL